MAADDATIVDLGNDSTRLNCTDVPRRSGTLFSNVYNGIPETLLLNVICWVVLILAFTILRYQAGDRGRHALVGRSNGNKKRWTEIFYSRALWARSQQSAVASGLSANEPNIPHLSPVAVTPSDHGVFGWIRATFKLRKETILLHTGPDAVHYLSFQRHLMIVMAIITAVSLLIILPVNFFAGTVDSDAKSFRRSTMANLTIDSGWLWVHVVVIISYIPLVVLIMRRSSGRNAFKKAPTRTIMITNIAHNDRNKTVICNFIQELFPEVAIEDVTIAYNISKLYARNAEFERVFEARCYCEHHRDRDNITVRPNYCSCKKQIAFEYYKREEQKLSGDIARLRASALNEPLDTAFLTVSTVAEAQNIVSNFTPGSYRQWHLSFAPSPDDLFWENLNVSKSHWYLKWFAVNFVLFLVLFFLTTPAMVVNLLNTMPWIQGTESLSPLLLEFAPTLMLWTLSALMPVIVAISDKWMAHYTRSLQNYSIMTKCFGYLLLMILILPSLGLTSAQALIGWTFENDTSKWQCFFLPDRSAFYINYVITAGVIGTALELLRFPELIVYIWMLVTAKSKAETSYIRKSILIEFPFGTHYAWTTLVFTISTVYSVVCPLIMPFAMIYICMKHFVDRHNLYFAYGPSNMISRNGGKIHSTAVTMTKFSVVILLLVMSMYFVFRGSKMRAFVLIVTMAMTLTLFTFMSPIKRCAAARRPSIVEIAGPAPVYMPDVLRPRTTPPTPYNGSSNGSSRMDSTPVGMMTGSNNGNSGYVGYGTDSVSDFDISSQCSAEA